MEVAKLTNIVQTFSWGSRDYLPDLLGYANAEQLPQAELWMGVHPKGESRVGAQLLGRYLRGENGVGDSARALSSLPFLFKILAAEKALSIQVHPNREQAEQGFGREERSGIPLDAPHRNYKDPNQKSEILMALTPFWTLCGFRPLERIERDFTALLGPERQRLALRFDSLREFFQTLMNLEPEPRSRLIRAVLAKLDPGRSPDEWILRLQELYPGDIGILAPLYLNLFCLEPGEAVFLRPGVPHSYLEGAGVELMTNSDNVLRGGLTPKHKDLAELTEILLFEPFEPEILRAEAVDGQRSYYASEAEEFRLERWELRSGGEPVRFPAGHPVMIAFVYSGSASVNQLNLERGESCVIPADCGEVTVTGRSEEVVIFAALASPGRAR